MQATPLCGQYEDFLGLVQECGTDKGDRTGTGTRSIFGHQMRFDLAVGFPLITTKKVFVKGVIAELLWILSGSTNVKPLQDQGVHIWDEWAREDGSLGPVYGEAWRSWPAGDGTTIDQISDVIKAIKTNPNSRRLIVTAWNPATVDQAALPPCHCFFQFYVVDGRLSCQLYQRSADLFLGVPFNLASYALLVHMIAQQCDLQPGEFIWTGGDCHIYDNHKEQVAVQLSRELRPLPTLKIKRRPDSIFDYKLDDFEVEGYDPHPTIKGEVAV